MRASPSRFAAATCALALLAIAPVALAAVPEPPTGAPPASAPDTSRFLPAWLHLHASLGFGWIATPTFLRQRYEAGQDIEFGVETRMRKNFRLRLNGEYQALPALGQATYQTVIFRDLDGGEVRDTLSFDWRARGWLGAARMEAQWQALPHTWLLGGFGRGYLGAGLRAFHFADPFTTLDVHFPGSSGWAWITSAGMRYDIDFLGPVLGAEVRWSSLDRPQDRLQTWSIRIGWQGR